MLAGCDGIECAGTTNNNCQAPRVSAQDRPFEGAEVRHDDRRSVTCWVYSSSHYNEGGISCLPDWMLTAPKGGMAVRP